MKKLCKICGSETEEFSHPKFDMDFYQCKECEFIFKDERLIVSPEEELKIYDFHNNSIEDEKYVEYFRKFINYAVLEHADVGKEGLDFGSGPSPVLSQVLERDYGYNMDIYDIFYSPEKVYRGKTYDIVTSTEVVEHLENPLEYFCLFKKLLKENGILSVMTLFHKNDRKHLFDWFYIRDESHISFYTPKTMEIISEIIGLKLIYTNNERYITFAIDL